MHKIKTTKDHTIYQKRSGRYAIKERRKRQWVRGDDKIAVLTAEGLREAPAARAPATAGGEAEAQTAENAQ